MQKPNKTAISDGYSEPGTNGHDLGRLIYKFLRHNFVLKRC